MWDALQRLAVEGGGRGPVALTSFNNAEGRTAAQVVTLPGDVGRPKFPAPSATLKRKPLRAAKVVSPRSTVIRGPTEIPPGADGERDLLSSLISSVPPPVPLSASPGRRPRPSRPGAQRSHPSVAVEKAPPHRRHHGLRIGRSIPCHFATSYGFVGSARHPQAPPRPRSFRQLISMESLRGLAVSRGASWRGVGAGGNFGRPNADKRAAAPLMVARPSP
jgi:hypothetical protein